MSEHSTHRSEVQEESAIGWRLDHPADNHMTAKMPGYHCIAGGKGYVSHEDDDTGFNITGFISLSNARIMVAAPELLESLRQLVAEIDPHGDMTDADLSSHRPVIAARAALAKAGVTL